jgi:hypothetical protein
MLHSLDLLDHLGKLMGLELKEVITEVVLSLPFVLV